jgi:hypothetical protein
MSKYKLRGMPARDTTEWNNAWETICRLATARQVALHDLRVVPVMHSTIDMSNDLGSADGPRAQHNPIDQGQLERAIVEIEQASAALKNAEPGLEAWVPDAAPGGEPRKPRSVWILIGTIWLAMLLIVGGVIGAIAYFLD